MQTLYCVIVDNGDGSNSLRWTTYKDVVDEMETLANDGDEYYASGDGLQVREFKFQDDFDLESWMKLNRLTNITEI